MRVEKELKNWELINFCEFDQYATKSYCAIHDVDESLNLGDITKVDETKLKPFNMICGGSPCQDFSVAGKQKGSVWTCKDCGHEYNPLTVYWSKRDKCPCCDSENIEKTRSSLLVEYLRVIRANKPNFGMYENVKNIVGKQFRDTTFKLFEDELHEYGYNTYWKVLNAKDYGIPQNRERVYLIFIKKDLDNGKFVFPEGFDNGIRLKDVLEDEVDEKYYISDDKVQRFLTNLNSNNSLLYDPCQVKREGKSREYNDYCPTLTSRDYKDPRLVNENVVKQVGNISECNGNWKNPQVGRVYDPDGCSPTLNTCGGGSHEAKILQVGKLNSSQDGIVVSDEGIAPTHTAGHGNTPKVLETPEYSYCLDANYYKGTTIEQYVGKHRRQLISEIKETEDKTIVQKPRGFNKGGEHDICPTLSSHSWECNNFVKEQIRIRKLTPKETFRLMGFSDSAYQAASKVVSNSQLYKQSGNSIVVDVLYYILVELYKAMPYLFDDLKLSSFFSGIGAFEIALDRLYESVNTGNFTKPQAELDSVCGENKLDCIGMLEGNGHEIRRRIYNPEGIAPTLCGVGCGGNTEPKIIIGAAMRGRYNSDGKTEQQIEVRDDELSNAITTVQKDSLVVEKQSWLEKKYIEFYEKNGYFPECFEPYNCREIKDYSPTLTAHSNSGATFAGTVLIAEIDKEKKQ